MEYQLKLNSVHFFHSYINKKFNKDIAQWVQDYVCFMDVTQINIINAFKPKEFAFQEILTISLAVSDINDYQTFIFITDSLVKYSNFSQALVRAVERNLK